MRRKIQAILFELDLAILAGLWCGYFSWSLTEEKKAVTFPQKRLDSVALSSAEKKQDILLEWIQ